MKRSPLRRYTPLRAKKGLKTRSTLKRTKLRVVGHSTTSQLKQDIQGLLRQVVIARDKGCILRDIRHCDEVEKVILQADHLITRANSATYADSRLVVCLCRPCHGGFKKWHKEKYDTLVKSILPKETVELWEKCEKDSWNPVRITAMDWKLAILALKKELQELTR